MDVAMSGLDIIKALGLAGMYVAKKKMRAMSTPCIRANAASGSDFQLNKKNEILNPAHDDNQAEWNARHELPT